MNINIKALASLRQRPDFKYRVSLSLYLLVLGIFLLPNIAFFSTLSDERLIELTNEVRSDEGLSPLTANQLLTKAAHEKATAIFADQRFSHTLGDRRFSAWVQDTGYAYTFIGENLAIDFVTSEGAMKAWLDSPTHRQNIMNGTFSETGIAVVDGMFRGEQATLVVQLFGAPTAAATAPAATRAPGAVTGDEQRLSNTVPAAASPAESAFPIPADPAVMLSLPRLRLDPMAALPRSWPSIFQLGAGLILLAWTGVIGRSARHSFPI